jgi:hypothetical protein
MAAPVTFNFTGTVNQHISTTPLSGSFTFDPDPLVNPDLNANAGIGRYSNAITALSVNLGAFSGVLDSAGNNVIRIVNTASLDAFDVRAPLVGSVGENIFFRITLKDPSGTAFNNDHLPTTPPSLGDFVKDRYRLVFEDGNGTARVSGSLTSLTTVPLPAAVILFGAGLVALIGLGAGTWRKRNKSFA